jgi:LmbE family N-acetylglucosaminyl deacetylase
MNILSIGAHPDDIELGCGGTLIKAAREGHRVFMYVLTRGGASGDPAERTAELIASANFIGAEKMWIDNFEDTKITVSNKLINHLEYFIHKVNPDIIFTHSAQDYHHDHRAIAEATMEAGRFSQNVLAYEVPVTKSFNPQVYYDISDVIDDKISLVKLFWSQRNKLFTHTNAVRGMAEYRTIQSRLSTALSAVESFEVAKMCLGKNFEPFKLPQQPLPKATIQNVDLAEILEHSAAKPLVAAIKKPPAVATASTPKGAMTFEEEEYNGSGNSAGSGSGGGGGSSIFSSRLGSGDGGDGNGSGASASAISE